MHKSISKLIILLTVLSADPAPGDANHEGITKSPPHDVYAHGHAHGCDADVDSDRDGLQDGWELEHFGGLDQGPDADPDSDGIPNYAEHGLSTDPNDDNRGGRNACNRPPVMSTTLSHSSVREEQAVAVLLMAEDADADQVRLFVDYRSICDVGECLDPPEYYDDPARPVANLYWVPAVGRAGQSYVVTCYACDDRGACAEPQDVMIQVAARWNYSPRITNPYPYDKVIHPDGIRAYTVTDGAWAYLVPTEPDPLIYTIEEGQELYVGRIMSYPQPDADYSMHLKAEVAPALESGTDVPRFTANGSQFQLRWTPSHVRGTADYTFNLVPHYDHFPSTDSNDWLTFIVRVKDNPLISYPQDCITGVAGETLGFHMLTEEWGGGEIVFDKPLEKPATSTFDTQSRHFEWTPTLNDVGGYHKLTLRMHADGYPEVDTTILIGVLSETDGNLVINPAGEFGEINGDDEYMPHGWYREGHDPETENTVGMAGDDTDRHFISERTSTNEGSATSAFGWCQDVYLTPSTDEVIPPGAIYEFSCSFRVEDVGFNWKDNDPDIMSTSYGMGADIRFYADNGEILKSRHRSYAPVSYEAAFDPDRWSDADGCYYDVTTDYDSEWKTYRAFIQPHPKARYAQIRTYHVSPGRIYLDDFSLRRVYSNPHVPAFQKEGVLSLLEDDEGEPVFLVSVFGDSPREYAQLAECHDSTGGAVVCFDHMRKLGFNLAHTNSNRVDEHIASGLYAAGETFLLPYYHYIPESDGTPASSEVGFRLGHEEGWFGGFRYNVSETEALADAETDGLKVLLLDGPDESNYRVERSGAPHKMQDLALRELNHAAETFKEIVHKPYCLNIMRRDWDPVFDEPHARLMDVVQFTWNCPTSYSSEPNAYSNASSEGVMARVGQYVRRWRKATADVNDGQPKPVIAFGVGVDTWARWDSYPAWNYQFIPFHLQRFQVYNQVVNGACGVRFYIGGHVNLDDVKERHHWDQMVQMAGEFASLYDLYALREFYDEWESDQDIEAMFKRHDGKIYLIATNPSEDVLGDVTITLDAQDIHEIISVKALFENEDTNSEHPMLTPDDGIIDADDARQIRRRGITRMGWERTVSVNPDGLSFTDTFIDFAVHVYEIEYGPPPVDEDVDGLPDQWEEEHFGNREAQDAEGDPDFDGLQNIDEYNYGADPNSPHSDDDGMGDGHEVHHWETDPTNSDTDGDGTNDMEDNCRTTYNYYQTDTDGDGMGDVCDACPDTPEGTSINQEGCPDCNANGVRDACDISSGTSSDCNDNGIPDECHGFSVAAVDTLAGGNSAIALATNSSGQLAGYSYVDEQHYHAALWAGGVVTDLGTLGGTTSIARDLNDAGQVIGMSINELSRYRAFLWEDAVMTDLGTLGGDYAQAYGINNNGQVAGFAKLATAKDRAFIWQDGAMINLGTLGGETSQAYGVNDLGQVVGASRTAEGDWHAFLWDDGVMIDLGTLGGGTSEAHAINNLGQVVGRSQTEDSYQAFLWEDGVMTALNTTPGTTSEAWGINDYGHVVGQWNTTGGSVAFLWRHGVMIDLNDWLPIGSEANLSTARDINDAGLIVCVDFVLSEIEGPDCNENGRPDECDVDDGSSLDCNGNGIPDECDAEYSDVRLFIEQLLAVSPDPVLVCMFDQNDDQVLNGSDVQGYVDRLVGP